MSEQPQHPSPLPLAGAGTLVGRNAVREALAGGLQIDTLYIKAPTQADAAKKSRGPLQEIVARAKQQGVLVKQVPTQKLDALSDGVPHQGVVATCAAIAYESLQDLLLRLAQKDTPPFLLICDEIADPHNLGAILRTAEATGVDAVIIPKRRSVGVTQTVYKTSAGAASVVPVCRVGNLAQTVKTLKNHGVFTYCADVGGTLWCEQDYAGGVALIIGSEGTGISPLLKKETDFCVSLPMVGQLNSLNASVATGVLLYEIMRQRLGKHPNIGGNSFFSLRGEKDC